MGSLLSKLKFITHVPSVTNSHKKLENLERNKRFNDRKVRDSLDSLIISNGLIK